MDPRLSLFVKKFITCRSVCLVRFKNALRRKPIRVLASYDERRVPVLEENEEKSVSMSGNVIHQKTGIKLPIPPYVKLGETDERYAKIFSTIKSEKPGESQGKIMLEGIRLINDAIKAGVQLEMLFFSREETLSRIKFMEPGKVKLYKVLYKTLQLWSSLDTCPGIMGVFKKPTLNELKVRSEPVIPVTVLGYNIRSHRVMGSIIRNAASAGCKSVLFTRGCINVWNQKVMRAACGAHFHVPVIDNLDWQHVLSYVPTDASVYFVDSRSDCSDYVYDDLLESVQRNSDSDTEQSEEDESEYSEDDIENSGDKVYVTSKEDGGQVIVDKGYANKEHLSNYEPELLRTVCYSDITYPSKNIFVCVSDENFCEDPRAMKLGCDFGGAWLNIPSANKICNVSSSLALPIILYEIKRQLGEEYVLM